jgi:NAD(P)-dependent dehydrogenase (short-subunit alcohol dehydrogenase family)
MFDPDFLKNPLSLFDIRGKTAIITGATGAFGELAAKVLAGAGANVVLSAGNAEKLKQVSAECEKLGSKVETVAKRPSSEANCDAIVAVAVQKFGRVDILVVASGQNKVSKIVEQKPDDFLDVMDANVTQSWLMARAAGRQMLKQGHGGKVILMSSARASGTPLATPGIAPQSRRWTALPRRSAANGARRHHGQCARPHRVSLAAHSMDVRGYRPGARRKVFTRVPKGRLGEPSDLPVPSLSRIRRRIYRSHPLCRRRLYGRRWCRRARIAVIGAGLMGHGIAQVFALAGHGVHP